MKFLFAWRYFRSKKSVNAINIIAWISVVAITIATAALIVVLSAFNGFAGLVKGMYGDFYADILVKPAMGKTIKLDSAILNKLKQVDGVVNYSLVASAKAILVNDDKQAIINFKGVDDNYKQVSNIQNHLLQKTTFNTGTVDEPLVVLGSGVESALNMPINNNNLLAYFVNKSAAGFNKVENFNSYKVKPIASFFIQQEFDNHFAFTNIAFIKYMTDMQADEYSSIEIKSSVNNYTVIKKKIQAILGKNCIVEDKFEQDKGLFTAMQIEKLIIYLVFALVLMVAAFNIIGSITLLVLEKEKDIAVLKALGYADGIIQGIYMRVGLLLAGIGCLSGIAIALILCFIQIIYKPIKLGGNTFIIDYYPVEVQVTDIVIIAAIVFAITWLAAYLPSRKAAKNPIALKV